MANIVRGADVTFDYTLTDADGTAFELAGSRIVITATDADGDTALTHVLELSALGNIVEATGLAVGPSGSSSGVVVQTLSAATTVALPVGRLAWKLALTDSTGKQSTPLRGQWVVVAEAQAPVEILSEGPTRAQLRRRIAQSLGDYRALEATAAGTTTTFIDALNISSATEDLSGTQFVVTSGANAGHIARVQATNGSLNQITFIPAAPQPFAAGDTLDVVMRRGRGWEVREYHQAINDAIADAFPATLAELATTGQTFMRHGELIVPAEMYEVYAVEWRDSEDNWHPLPKAQRTNGWGWRVNAVDGTISITDMPGYLADEMPIRIYGYGRPQPLTADGQRTSVNAEWLAARACYYLVRGGMDRDQARGSLILLFEREAAQLRPRLRTLRKGATARVRWA